MLLVGRGGLDGDGRAAQFLDEREKMGTVRFEAAVVLLLQPLLEQPPDAEAEQEIGEDVAGEEGVEHFGKVRWTTDGHRSGRRSRNGSI